MGLDQYLYAKKHVSGYRSDGDEETIKYKEIISSVDGLDIADKRNPLAYVSFCVGYWRKCNAIHNWLVENIQDGKDDCGEYHFGKSTIGELLNICKRVLANKESANKELPTVDGFFFGSTNYDEFYYQDIEETVVILQNALTHPEFEYYYASSW